MKKHLTCLDGIRGLLALWVFWSHASLLTGCPLPLLSKAPLAVDLFMLLSGFLMAYHWRSGGAEPAEPAEVKTKFYKFWVRRFFRIAPVYYCLLLLAYGFSAYFLNVSHRLAAAFPPPWAASKFVPPTDYSVSLPNVLSHFSFVYGLIPRFASNDAMPDWSLSLEMQFYLFFPFLMAFMRRSRILWFVLGAVAASVVTPLFFGLYLENGIFGNFPQPTLILYKIHIFAAGMILGCVASQGEDGDLAENKGVSWLAFFLCLLFIPKLGTALAALIAALVMGHSRPVAMLNKLLSNRVFKFLGDISYSVYLAHIMLLYVILDRVLHVSFFTRSAPIVRFAMAVTVVTPLVFIAAYGLHKFVEIPGIELGKRLVKRRAGAVGMPAAQEAAM